MKRFKKPEAVKLAQQIAAEFETYSEQVKQEIVNSCEPYRALMHRTTVVDGLDLDDNHNEAYHDIVDALNDGIW